MARLVGGPVRYLENSRFKSEASFRAELYQSLATRARLVEELASGVATGDRAISGPNPQGTLGCDLSGPPWGSAILHPVATSGGLKATGGVTGERQAVETITATARQVGPFIFWNRPHAELPYPYVAPYSRLYFACRAYSLIGASALTVTLQVLSMLDGSVVAEESQVHALSTTEATITSLSSFFRLCGSGRMAAALWLKSTSNDSMITAWSILQMKKRTH